MAKSGTRWKKHNPGCPCCNCAMFDDDFDRGGPTQVIGSPWDEANAIGEWWIDASTHPKYPNDSALYEVSGTGEIWGPWANKSDGYSAEYDIIDEAPHTIYRIYFGAPGDDNQPFGVPLPGVDCLIAEYEVGEFIDDDSDGQPDFTSAVRVYRRTGGVETLVEEKYFPPQATNSQDGRRFYAYWINTNQDNTFCTWIGSSAYPSRLTIIGLAPPETTKPYFGIGNASGSDAYPIEVDDFKIEVLGWEGQDGQETACFACLCVCYDYDYDDPDNYPTPIDRQLYPGVLTVRFWGECCTPLFTPCDTSSCPSVDETFTAEYEDDMPSLAFNGWYNHVDVDLCGYPFQFRFECDGQGILGLSIYYEPSPGAGWQFVTDTTIGDPLRLELLSHSCNPIHQLWKLTLSSLSGFPCCIPPSCTTGAFYIDVSA